MKKKKETADLPKERSDELRAERGEARNTEDIDINDINNDTNKEEKEPVAAFVSPVYRVIAVPVEKVEANTYNPNSVAPPEMRLLYDSIREDGYTMPVVCYYDAARDKYIIVDGFHRYRIMMEHPDIYQRERGLLPVSVIDKALDYRMASTIRHNRARGTHDVDLMSNIVRELHELGRSDQWISQHLGMDMDEILRLKQITGLSALFKDYPFGQAWIPVEDADDINVLEMAEEAAMQGRREPRNTLDESL